MNPQNRSYHTFFAQAIDNLTTGTWALYGNTYESIQWQEGIKPSKDAVEAEAQRLQTEWSNTEYQRLRAPEYPPVGDQLDALWKGGDVAAEMLARVQAVKAQYPKPEDM
jgi:hypothetical protein